jgi:hypothetical protein
MKKKKNTHTQGLSFLDSATKEKMDETKEYEKTRMKMEKNLKNVAHAQLFSPPLDLLRQKTSYPSLLCMCVQVLPPDSRKAPASIACGTRKQKK